MVLIRSILYMLIQIPVTILFCIAACLLIVVPHRWRYYFVTRWTMTMLFFLKHICKITCEVIGQENIPKEPGVVLCKHQSAFETMYLQKIFPIQTWVIKRELQWVPFFGWGLALLHPIAIDRKNKASKQKLIADGIKKIAEGLWVVIFPEGTRVKVGSTGRFTRSGSELAIAANAWVVPVALNAGIFWPRNSFLKYPGKITIEIGKAFKPSDLNPNITGPELTDYVKEWIEKTTLKLEAQALKAKT
jgi:1-acyl-sn-glycerol-3-phosphate acyltransferase